MSDYTRPGVPKSDPSLLRLQLVGPMQALTLDNENVLPPGRKTRGLLAILAMSGRRPVLRSKLAEILWSRRSEEQARASLRQEIHRLLDSLAPVGAPIVSVERHSLALRPALTAVDAERLLNANVNHVIAQANAVPGPGTGSWSGGSGIGSYALPPLDGVLLEELNGTDPALDAWLATERARMHQHALGLFEAALQRRPGPVASIAICRQLMLLDPLHEAAWRGLIRAQLLQGERGAALQSADRCAELFSLRLSGEPGLETSRLLSELRNGNSNGIATESLPPDREPAEAAETGARPGPNAVSPELTAIEEDPVVSVAGQRMHNRSIATLAVLAPLDLDAGINDKLVPALTEELTARLAMCPIMAVISGSALAHSLAQGRDDALLQRKFGLDYVLDGTILRSRGRIRIILRLLDLRLQGHVVWAKRFDCDPSDAVARLDEIAGTVTAQLPWELLVIESRRVGSRPAAELTMAQLSLRAFSLVMRPDRLNSDKAGELLQRAEALDPDYPLVAIVSTIRHFIRAVQFWGSLPAEGVLAERAMHKVLGAGLPTAATAAFAGFIQGQLLDQPEIGLTLIDHAFERDDNMTMAPVLAAFLLVRLGELDEAEKRFAAYKRLYPLHPLHYLFDGISVTTALLQGRLEEAVTLGYELVELSPALLYPAIPLLAALGLLGRHDEARRLLARIQNLVPGLGIDRVLAQMQLQRSADRICLANGLRAAGMAQEHQYHRLDDAHDGVSDAVNGDAGRRTADSLRLAT